MKKMVLLVLVLVFMVVSCGGDDGNDTTDSDLTSDSEVSDADDNSGSGDDAFPQTHAGTTWISVADSKMTVEDATAYCTNLGGGLPDINELRSLIKDWPKTMTDGACEVTRNCSSITSCLDKVICGGAEEAKYNGGFSVFGENTNGEFWSRTKESSKPQDFHNWLVDFNSARVTHYYEGAEKGVLCISFD